MKKLSLILTQLVLTLGAPCIAATLKWDGGGDGTSWSDPLNWDTDSLPGPGDDVVIIVADSDPTITSTSSGVIINSLNNSEVLEVSGGSLLVMNALTNSGTIRSAGGGTTVTLNVSTWNNSGVLEATSDSGISIGASIASSSIGTFMANGGVIQFTGTVDNSAASIDLTSSTGSLTLTSGGTILGGTITTSDGVRFIGSNGILDGVTINGDLEVGVSLSDTELVIKNGLTLNGVAYIGHESNFSRGALSFEGSQTIGGTGTVELGFDPSNALRLTQADTTLTIGPDVTIRGISGLIGHGAVWGGPTQVNLLNEGTISADDNGGRIFINVPIITTAALGTFQTPGGSIVIPGILDNTGANLVLDSTTGSWTFNDGTILGGTITTNDGVRFIGSNSTLDGVTINGDLEVGASSNDAQLNIKNGLTLNGTAYIGHEDIFSKGALSFEGSQTLSGTGTVEFGSASSNALRLTQENSTLTIGSNITVRGASGMIGYAEIWGGPSQVNVINHGSIIADQFGTIFINVPSISTAALGTLRRPAGNIVIPGNLDNTGANLVLDSSTGSWIFNDGTILGGTITTNESVRLIGAGGTLDGVTINGDLEVGASSNDAQLNIKNGLTLNGTAYIGHEDIFTKGALSFEGTQTLEGTGVVILGSSTQNALRLAEADTTLTIAPNIIVRGMSGSIGNASSWGGPTQVYVDNQGLISADEMGGTILLTGPSTSLSGGIDARNASTIEIAGDLSLEGLGYIRSSSSGNLVLGQDLLGASASNLAFSPAGLLKMGGNGTLGSPQLLEVMSENLGNDTSGFVNNFAYGTIELGGTNNVVQLVDESDDSNGVAAECLYVSHLIVPADATLDLNGHRAYARRTLISGVVLGGSIEQIPDGGPLDLGIQIPGSIDSVGESDEWTFFARGGTSITVVIDHSGPMVPAPAMSAVQVELLDEFGGSLAIETIISPNQKTLLSGVEIPVEGNYRVQIQATPSVPGETGNYAISVWETTPDINPIVYGKTYLGSIEGPYSVDRWTFAASTNQQIKFNLQNTFGPGVQFDLIGPGNWIGFEGLTDSSGLINIPTDGVYTLTARGTGEQDNTTYTFNLEQTVIEELEIGNTFHGSLVGNGNPQLFSLEVTESNPLGVYLDDSASDNFNELYIKLGSPPTRGDFDHKFTGKSAPDQAIFVPLASAGTWYVLLYGDVVNTPGPFELKAESAKIFLLGISPEELGNSVDLWITISGAGFVPGTTVELIGNGNLSYTPGAISLNSFTDMNATFPADSIPAGTYTLRVTHPEGEFDDLIDAFEILDGGTAKLETNLILPSWVGRHAIANIYVEYENVGNIAMVAPLLVLNGSDKAQMTLDKEKLVTGFWGESPLPGFSDTVQILACGKTPGLLQPGESFRVPAYYVGLQGPWDFSDTSVQFDLGVFTPANDAPVDWNDHKADMRPSLIPIDAWEAVFANFVSQAGNTWGEYAEMLVENSAYLCRLGLNVTDISELLAFEIAQADGLSFIRNLASSSDMSVRAPGLPIMFSRTFPNGISNRYRLGKLGRGWSHNWEFSRIVEPNGNVSVYGPGRSVRTFTLDTRGGFFSAPGDYGKLSHLGGDIYRMQEKNGFTWQFRADGLLDFVEDTQANRITCSYTGGNLTRLEHSSGQYIAIGYNGSGFVDSLTDPVGRQTAYTYNGSGELLEDVEFFNGSVLSYEYDPGPQDSHRRALTAITYPSGSHRYFSYDSAGKLSGVSRDGGAESFAITYDGSGKSTLTDALGGSTEVFLDHRGLIAQIIDPLGNPSKLDYDSAFNLVKITDPAGRFQQLSYDDLGNVIELRDASGSLTQFSYDSQYSYLASIKDTLGNQTNYSYDLSGNLESITYPDNSVESWDYDSFGQPTKWTNRRGQDTTHSFNSHGQLDDKQLPDAGAPLTDYVYDSRSNLIEATNEAGTIVMEYFLPGHPSVDRLKKITYPGEQWLEYTYCDCGRRESMTDHLGHRLDYHYDAVGRLERISDENSSDIVTYSYDAVGRLERKDLGNGMYTTYDYDAASQLLDLHNHQVDDSTISRFEYTYDPRGRRTTMTTTFGVEDPRIAADLEGTWNYSYDDLGQLIAWSSPDGTIVDYEYDALGNRVTETRDGVTTTYTTNELNQYTLVSDPTDDTTFSYDLDGNMISSQAAELISSFEYDGENRMKGSTHETWNATTNNWDIETWRWSYDGFNRRWEGGIVDDLLIQRVTDPFGYGNVVGEYDGDSGDTIKRFDYGFGLLTSADNSEISQFYTFDAAGNTSDWFDEDLTQFVYAYEPFGESSIFSPLSEDAAINENHFMFVGEFGIQNGVFGSRILDMRSRQYFVSLGRFNSKDPIGIQSGDFNLYRYVGNLPISKIDPSGLAEIGANCSPSWLCQQWIADFLSSDFFTSDDDLGRLQEHLENVGLTLQEAVMGYYGPSKAGPGGTGTPGGVWFPSEDLPGGGVSRNPFQPSSDFLKWPGNGGNFPAGYDSNPNWPEPPPKNPNLKTEDANSINTDTVNAIDPNEKLGPSGYGTANYVKDNQSFAYRINFENLEEATAPAQVVKIDDALGSDLDVETFELTGIGWADEVIDVPNGLQYFETKVDFSYLDIDFEVQIDAGINLAEREVFARFYSINPDTGLPPPVQAGFLPPEDGTGRGQGYITYTIRPKLGVSTGTEIRNIALIKFDTNEIIATNQVDPLDASQGTDPNKEALVTIDAEPPTSSVDTLPATTESVNFTVSWAGNDGAGSGVASYDVYRSLNNGAFEPWQMQTTALSANYRGNDGDTLSFVSIARDNLGQIEDKLLVAEATTVIDLPPVHSWLAIMFPSDYGDPATELTIWGTDANSEGDGGNNLFEYYSGYDPRLVDIDTILATSVEGENLVCEYRKDPAATGVVAEVEWSADLLSWHTNDISYDTPFLDEGYEIHRAKIPLKRSVRLFARLKVREAL